MAKRGETRPWRLAFEWDSGVKGTLTFRTHQDAQARARAFGEYAERIGRDVVITLSRRPE